jgi:hypothetical protein
MLVRFLSYAASVIGAKRYKPMLISCLALVFSITGISIVVSSIVSGSPDASSQVTQNSKKSGQEQTSTSLGGLQQKNTKDDNANVQQPDNSAGTKNTTNQQPSTSNATAANFDFTLNATTVSLSQASINSAVTVTTDDNSTVQWSINPESQSGVNGKIEQSKDNNGTAVIRFRADSVTPGTYQFTVTAKDAARSINTSKTITVTVN